ncbi:MAG: VOC family protein [Bryobacteraceae bacterium]
MNKAKFAIVSTIFAATAAFGQLPAPNEAGVGMGHLHLTVRDIDAHKKLWVGVMGAKPVMMGNLEVLKLPDVIVMLRKGEPAAGSEGSAVNHLGFKVKDLDATIAKLTAAGARVQRTMPETRQAFLLFPDEVKVEFSEDKSQTIPLTHHHIHFFTQDVEATRAWYAKMFAAKPGRRLKFEAADLPGVNLTFSPSETKTVATKGRAVDHIGFEVRNLESFCKEMEKRGVKFDVPFKKVPALGLSIAFFTDPWGTYVELTEGMNKL